MSLVSWAKKELARLKNHSHKRLLPPETILLTPPMYSAVSSPISEVVLAADLRCIKCQERVAAILSAQDNDLESVVIHVIEKKVTISRKPINT